MKEYTVSCEHKSLPGGYIVSDFTNKTEAFKYAKKLKKKTGNKGLVCIDLSIHDENYSPGSGMCRNWFI